MLTAIATAFGIGYNVARLGTSLRVQSVLLRHRPQCLSDGYCDTLVAQALIQADAMRWRRGWHNVISLIDLSSFLYDMKNMKFCFPGYLAKNFRICYNADRLRDSSCPSQATTKPPRIATPWGFLFLLSAFVDFPLLLRCRNGSHAPNCRGR